MILATQTPGRAQLKGIEVASQTDQSAQPGFVEVQPASAAGNQSRPMTYELNDDGKKLHIVVEALSEEKTTRMVKISYNPTQAVYRQTDAACLERQFFCDWRAGENQSISSCDSIAVSHFGAADLESAHQPGGIGRKPALKTISFVFRPTEWLMINP